jgi:hypothetical protein
MLWKRVHAVGTCTLRGLFLSHKGLIALIFYNSYTYIDLYSESELG